MSRGPEGRWGVLDRSARRLRAEGAVALSAVVLAVVTAVFLAGWLFGGWSVSWGPLATLVGVAVSVAVVGRVLFLRWVASVTEWRVAAAAESRAGLPQGSLRSVLELGRHLPPGLSRPLFQRSEEELAGRIAGLGPLDLSGELGARARSRRLGAIGVVGGLALLTAAAGVTSPDRARAGWEPLLHPVAHLKGPVLPPIAVTPGDVEVNRGGVVEVTVTAPGRSSVTVRWQVAGDVPRDERVGLTDAGGVATVGPVTDLTTYRVHAPDGATSPLFRIRPVDPLLVSALSYEVVYPPHTGRTPERLEGLVPQMEVPEGAVIRVAGRATRALESATFRRADGGARRVEVAGDEFAHDWTVGRGDEGVWELAIRDVRGADAVGAALALTVVVDAPPQVRILVPARDTVLGPSRRQPIVAEATDDHGIASAELVYRRIGARGERGAAERIALPLDGESDRQLLQAVLDATGLHLGPGDAVEYHVAVRDNGSPRQTAVSETYRLMVPGREALRGQARAEANALREEARAATERARRLDRATRELNRKAATSAPSGRGGAGSAGPPTLDHERASEARQLAEEHEEARAQVAELRTRLDAVKAALAEAGLRDPALERRLDRLQDLYADVSGEDAARPIEALRDAADALDPRALAEALERLSAMQEEVRRRLEESLSQLERAGLEQELNAAAREAEEIAAEQELLAAAMRRELGGEPGSAGEGDEADPSRTTGDAGDRAEEGASAGGGDPSSGEEGSEDREGAGSQAGSGEERAAQQEELARRAQSLNDLLNALQQQLLQTGDPEAAGQAGAAREQGQAGQSSMEQAAEQARGGQGEEAAESGESAAESMSAAAKSLDEARGGMGESGARAVQEAVQQATQDALRLAEREEALRERMEQAGAGSGAPGSQSGELQAMQSEQAAVRQGLEQLGRNLAEADRQAGMLDRQLGQALARAMLALDQTQEGLARGGALPVREASRAVDALNQLALSLLESDARMGGARGGDAEEATRRLAELAGEQGALNAQGGAFAPLDLPPSLEGERTAQMAESQRGIARRIGDLSSLLGGREDVSGQVSLLSQEAESIARTLEGGRLTPETRARQERLFHRLLDAGRTLERDEFTEERVGEAALAAQSPPPPMIDPALLEAIERFPAPTSDQLRGLPPAYQRLVVEYFQRLNGGGATGGGSQP
jgi:hypothetical protein